MTTACRLHGGEPVPGAPRSSRPFTPTAARYLATASACCTVLLPWARAEGFRSPTIGTAGLGTSGGRIVFVDDASAVAHNPANLMKLDRWEASFEPTLAYHSVEYLSPAGGTASTENPWKPMPHVFAAGPVLKDRVALGLGVTVPYGLSIDWGDGGALASLAPHYVDLKTFDVAPTLALKLAPGLSVGAGLDFMWSELEFRQMGGLLGLPASEIRGKGDGVGYGGHLALTWNPYGPHWLAATVRAPMDVTYAGGLSLNNVPGVPGGVMAGPLTTGMAFPTIVGAGYGIELCPCVRVEANVEWLQFSRFDTLDLQTTLPLPPAFMTQVHNWRDTVTAGVAGSWDVGRGWRLRLGYQFFQTPVPDATFSPAIPDADQHTVTFGVGYRHGRHRLDLAYAPVFYEERTIPAPSPVAGRYTFTVHLISAAYGFSF
ncbi:MAG: outer membrane protein transport protein [Verrucomicrobiales bacterium]|nr:outer membrane protein transport protein [Verrucomicrobiales bacterium]